MHTTISLSHLAPSLPRRGLVRVWMWGAISVVMLATPVVAQVAPPFEAEAADGLDSASSPTDSGAPSADRIGDEATTSEAPALDAPTPQRRLLVLDTDYLDLETLGTMLRVQAPDWEFVPQNVAPSFLRIDRLLQDLAPHEALLLFESGNPMIRIAVIGPDGESYVSLLPRSDATPPAPGEETPQPSSPAEVNSTRSVALVVAALLSEMEHRQQQWQEDALEAEYDEAAESDEELQRAQSSRDALAARVRILEEQLENLPVRPNRWPSPIKPDGWFFRLGWVQAFSPTHEFSFGSPYSWAYPTGGVRIAAGRHFRSIFSVGASVVTLHAYGIWNGSVSAFASVHSPHRFRVGIGLEVGVLVATESNQWAGTSIGWVSPRFYIPVEFAGIFTRKGGVSIKCGPTILSTPVGGFVGYDLSVEWEFD